MQQVADWLEKLGLGQYAQRFAENDISFAVLPDLTDQHLEKIGIASLGHRLQLLRAIAELSKDAPSAAAPTAPTAAPQDTAERRQLTVMFSDLVGSTALSARMDPEDLREVISAYQKCVVDAVQRFGGFVAKYMGDGVLVYFGYPQAHEDDAERAVRAGLELIQAVGGLKSSTSLQTRVGIATGLVVVGDLIGSGAAQEQTVVGKTPNLAARLQGLAEPNSVVIAESTRKLLGNLFELEDLGARELKGNAEPVRAWAAMRASAVESRFEALRATSAPMVGRHEEIDLLLRRWDQAKQGDGQVVLISGEPGIGKSRIAQTIVQRISGEPHIRLQYFCSPYHEDSAFYPSINQLERAAGFRREDTPEQRLAKLETVLAEGTNDLNEAVPLLADLLSIPIGERYPPLDLTPQKRKEKTLHAQLAQVEGLAARQAVLMVFEDVHWSDPTTRELLDLLLDRAPTLRVLVIITFRPEFTPPWIGRPHVTMLTLNRLPAKQTAEVITHVTRGKVLPKDVEQQIVHRTDGVPLFIEELTKTVVESGILTETGDHYTVTGPVTRLAIPTSLHASLLERLDRLAPMREVAQIGAVLGRSFSHELISAVADMSQQKLDNALTQLVTAELMFRRGTPPDAEYTFKHALVQDAAYSTLLRGPRRQLHARIARTLESQFPEIVIAQPQLMAQHCAEGGLLEKAVAYWLQAGQRAGARSAMLEAVAQLQKGLDLLASMPPSPLHQQQELDLRMALGPALAATKGFSAPDVGKNYAQASALAEQVDRPDCLVPLLVGQFFFHGFRAEHRVALSFAEQIERMGEVRNDPAALCLGHYGHGVSSCSLGDFVSARALFEKCHRLGDSVDRAVYAVPTLVHLPTSALAWLAVDLTHLGYIDQGRARMREVLGEARRIEHVHTLVMVLIFACWVERTADSPDDARLHAEEALTLSNEHGFPHWLGWGHLYHGWSLVAVEQAEEGLTLLEKGLSFLRATGSVAHTPLALVLLAEAYAKFARPMESFNYLTEAAQIIEMTDERCDQAELHRVRGDLLNAIGDGAAAEQNYHQALSAARPQGARIFELRAATSLARLWRDQGKLTEACDLLTPIYGWFTEGFDTPVLQDAKALLDQLG
jgi:class 3 adenylate cyclase/tetratricopeptide (TPR) repeat protein